jgi:hypothetical protein
MSKFFLKLYQGRTEHKLLSGESMSMRKLILFGFCIVAIMASGLLHAGTVDEDSMGLMKDKQKSLSSNLSLNDTKGATDDANEILDMFNDVEDFFIKKGNAQDAVDWTKQSKDMLSTIVKYVGAKDFDTAAKTSVTLAKTCKECHNIYKKD